MIRTASFFIALLPSLAFGGGVTFSLLPSTGSIAASLDSVVGWGYTVENDTPYFLVPLGLSNSGTVYGSLVDIFDYPVIDPGHAVYQEYAYNPPGGFGYSLGLYEYAITGPEGFVESGTISLTYQLYTGNPDFDLTAEPFGAQVTEHLPFSATTSPTTPVPEPPTLSMMAVSFLLIVGYGLRRTAGRRREH